MNNLHYDLGRNFIDLDIKCKQQQKEIEELKEVKWYYEISRVPKDKIKAILKKYGKKEIEYSPDFYKEIQSLLEEE